MGLCRGQAWRGGLLGGVLAGGGWLGPALGAWGRWRDVVRGLEGPVGGLGGWVGCWGSLLRGLGRRGEAEAQVRDVLHGQVTQTLPGGRKRAHSLGFAAQGFGLSVTGC